MTLTHEQWKGNAMPAAIAAVIDRTENRGMTTITGIDVSLASTGVARLTTDDHGKWMAESWCRASVPHSGPGVTGTLSGGTLKGRAARIREIVADVLFYVDPCDLAVIEGPSYGQGRQGGTFDRAWLWGALVAKLLQRGVPCVEIPPATRAKFAVNVGGADKAAVALAMGRMWPDWAPGNPKGVNDQADALALASIGVVLAGLHAPFPMPAYRTRALAKVPLLGDVA